MNYPLRWRVFKTWFSRQIPAGEARRDSRIVQCERGIWQRRYWEHLIKDNVDMQRHVDYLHFTRPSKGRSRAQPIGRIRHFVVTLLSAGWRRIGACARIDGVRGERC